MAIVKTLSSMDFQDAFYKMGRDKQFSYDALDKLYEFYTEVSEECGTPFEMDVIAICCDWTEYDSFKELYNAYDLGVKGKKAFLDELWNHTTFYEVGNGRYLVQNF